MAYRPVNPQQTAAFLRQQEQNKNSNRFFGGMKASSAAHGLTGVTGKMADSTRKQARRAARQAKWGAGIGIAALVASIVNPWLGAAVNLAGGVANKSSKPENARTKKLMTEKAGYEKQLAAATKSGKHVSTTAKQGVARIIGEGERETALSNRYAAKKMKQAGKWGDVAKVAKTAAGIHSLYTGWQDFASLAPGTAVPAVGPSQILEEYQKGIYYA